MEEEKITPATDAEKRAWAIRRYHGIGEGGTVIDEWTQSEIASALDMSRQTVNRWVNSPLTLVENMSYRERMTLYACALRGDGEALSAYINMCNRV